LYTVLPLYHIRFEALAFSFPKAWARLHGNLAVNGRFSVRFVSPGFAAEALALRARRRSVCGESALRSTWLTACRLFWPRKIAFFALSLRASPPKRSLAFISGRILLATRSYSFPPSAPSRETAVFCLGSFFRASPPKRFVVKGPPFDLAHGLSALLASQKALLSSVTLQGSTSPSSESWAWVRPSVVKQLPLVFSASSVAQEICPLSCVWLVLPGLADRAEALPSSLRVSAPPRESLHLRLSFVYLALRTSPPKRSCVGSPSGLRRRSGRGESALRSTWLTACRLFWPRKRLFFPLRTSASSVVKPSSPSLPSASPRLRVRISILGSRSCIWLSGLRRRSGRVLARLQGFADEAFRGKNLLRGCSARARSASAASVVNALSGCLPTSPGSTPASGTPHTPPGSDMNTRCPASTGTLPESSLPGSRPCPWARAGCRGRY